MLPIGRLMIEHRLIERVIKLWVAQLEEIDRKKSADVAFIDRAVDFMKAYADRCHHGKEENILFRDLKAKLLPADISRILDELIREHVVSRNTIAALVAAKHRYLAGEEAAIKDIRAAIQTVTELYPQHIEKEDKRFFLPVMEYFSKEEKERMLEEFREFDQNLIHERYRSIVAAMESG